jgi:conjugative transfer region protein (TIGR03750 family)
MADLLAERLNLEPAVFRGYTDTELVTAIVLAGLVCFPAGLVGGLAVGRSAVGIGLAMVATLGLVVLGASRFQEWKRGRPDFWLQQRAHLALAETSLVRTPLFRHRGALSLGRNGYDHPDRQRRRLARRK